MAYHEVEPSHEKDHVDKKEPVLLQRHFAFLHEDFCGIGGGFSDPLALLVGLRFWEAETEDDDQDWWSSAKPEELGNRDQLSVPKV